MGKTNDKVAKNHFPFLCVFRLIPCRSQTDMQLAQHLLSPMSHHAGSTLTADDYDSEQQDSRRQVTRILNFGNKTMKAKPFSPVTAFLACGTTTPFVHPPPTKTKSKFKIPTKPDRVMAAPGTFLECGKFVC